MNFVPPELDRILRQTPELRNAFLVGGCVRDALLDCPGKDFDVEVVWRRARGAGPGAVAAGARLIWWGNPLGWSN